MERQILEKLTDEELQEEAMRLNIRPYAERGRCIDAILAHEEKGSRFPLEAINQERSDSISAMSSSVPFPALTGQSNAAFSLNNRDQINDVPRFYDDLASQVRQQGMMLNRIM